MVSIRFLGTGNAVYSAGHANTCMAVEHAGEIFLVDCPEAPVARLGEVNVDPLKINHLILTHFHPDHVASVPVFMMSVWLMGRKARLVIHGLEDCITRLQGMLDLFRWQTWPELYPVEFHVLNGERMETVLRYGDLEVCSSPVRHIIPAVGLLFLDHEKKMGVAYSCDTEPSEAVIEMAQQARVLIHEANGASPGHSSAEQAGEIAALAGVEELVLVHYPGDRSMQEMLEEAHRSYPGVTRVARDLDFLEV